MATSGSDQPTDENTNPGNQQTASGEEPPKTAKQLAKEAEKAEKLRKFEEKQRAKAKADEEVPFLRLASLNYYSLLLL